METPLLSLPPMTNGTTPPSLPSSFRQLTLIGANGSGKTRFMRRLAEECGEKAYFLSVPEAFYPERHVSSLSGSIDALYSSAMQRSPYLKGDAVSEFDKLMFLLVNDECSYLLKHKSQQLFGTNPGPLQPTRLDTLVELWQKIFPDNRILHHGATLTFATSSGTDTVNALKLSKGEKAALYYIAGVLYAPKDGYVFIDSPSQYLHPALINTFWNAIERLRPDCRFVYNTYDVGFVAMRTEGVCIWVRNYDAESHTWDYRFMQPGALSDDLTLQLVGARRPVLFIEGDATHSIDAKLYTLVFSEYTVRPLGSCDKVIESTRAFSDLKGLHHLDSQGIVDRDRRTEHEVEYLRKKHIMVPEVAEVENLFLVEGVIKTMASIRGRNPEKTFGKTKNAVMHLWEQHLDSQALQHTRHRIKRLAQCRIDGRFHTIQELENHIDSLPQILKPRDIHKELLRQFQTMLYKENYAQILKVFNYKPMLQLSGIDRLLGFSNVDAYINAVLAALKKGDDNGSKICSAIRHVLK